LTLIDVGARWGVVDLWREFGDKAKVFCFEADEEEAQRLSAETTTPNIEYIPVALSDNDKGITLTITEGVGCTSAYRPIRHLYERYPGCKIMRPVRSIRCPSTTLDQFIGSRGIEIVDAIKLDTQGSELDILRGSQKALERCALVVVEVEFNPLYEGQPLFCDIDRFLRDRGFVLWRLNNLAHYSTGILAGDPHSILVSVDPGGYQYVPFENGQLFWADALYVKEIATPISDNPLAFGDAVAGAALVCQWRLWDLVIEMIRKAGDAALLSQIIALVPSAPPLATLPYQIEFLNREVAKLKEALEIERERQVKPES
jgi:FkbM family methyltransferase